MRTCRRIYIWCHAQRHRAASTSARGHRGRWARSARTRQDVLMAGLKDRLRADLTAAMKARDEVRTRTLRMALTSVSNEEVAGKAARELSAEEVLKILAGGPRRRREAAAAFQEAGRDEQAAAERAEDAVLAG